MTKMTNRDQGFIFNGSVKKRIVAVFIGGGGAGALALEPCLQALGVG